MPAPDAAGVERDHSQNCNKSRHRNGGDLPRPETGAFSSEAQLA
jgi:hypothetical protein